MNIIKGPKPRLILLAGLNTSPTNLDAQVSRLLPEQTGKQYTTRRVAMVQ